jgi:integrase
MKTLHRQTYLPTEKELDKISEAILTGCRAWYLRHRDWVIFKTGCYTGMRLNEIINLRISWIEFSERIITIPAEYVKNKEESQIYICNPLMKVLSTYIRQHKIRDYLFCSVYGNRLHASYWAYAWKEYLIIAGLYEHKYFNRAGQGMQKIRFHTSTRTNFINKVIKANPNRNMFELSKIFRHKSVQCTYDYYVRFKEPELRQEIINKTFK